MKGKKFNAAEKHFEEKCVIWRQKIRDVEREKREVLIENQNLKQRMKDIEKENEYLREINDEIMKLKDMSTEDVKLLLNTRMSIKRMDDVVNTFSRHSSNYLW